MTKELIWPFLAECTASVGSIIGVGKKNSGQLFSGGFLVGAVKKDILFWIFYGNYIGILIIIWKLYDNYIRCLS